MRISHVSGVHASFSHQKNKVLFEFTVFNEDLNQSWMSFNCVAKG